MIDYKTCEIVWCQWHASHYWLVQSDQISDEYPIHLCINHSEGYSLTLNYWSAKPISLEEYKTAKLLES